MTFIWPAEDGWPYPDGETGWIDGEAELDEDAIALHCLPASALDVLDPLERLVVGSRFGVWGGPVRSMKQLHTDTGRARVELRGALASGLAKLRVQLGAD
ncbi:MAG: hypothetical protein ACRD0J_04430 [Acidimicrobiales bacterium]